MPEKDVILTTVWEKVKDKDKTDKPSGGTGGTGGTGGGTFGIGGNTSQITLQGYGKVTVTNGSNVPPVTKEGFEFGKEYKNIGVFAGGFGAVQLENDKWTFIDKNFKPVGATFDKVSFFEGDFATVVLDGKTFVINKEFKVTAGPFEGVIFRQDDIFAVYENNPEEGTEDSTEQPSDDIPSESVPDGPTEESNEDNINS